MDYAWADCYVKSNGNTAAYIGGLAGRCGAESEFRHCYAAGFVVSNTRTFPDNINNIEGTVERQKAIADYLKDANHAQPITAAGFVPGTVKSIENAYSVFNFDDPTIGITGIVPGQYQGQPAVLKLAKKYKLAAAGTINDYAY
ncbi:MAG: hypothetical protein IKR84_05665, partial [Oscillibacter sp.]|nr:hypothetical protein [Oscillibacter sp.]